MSTSFYPVLEIEIEGIDVTSINGKAISAAGDVLESVAAKIGVKPLMSYFGADMSNFLAEEGFEGFEPGEKWFAAGDGLQTIRALLEFLEKDSNQIKNAENIVVDLQAFEQVLNKAEEADVCWHLAVDF